MLLLLGLNLAVSEPVWSSLVLVALAAVVLLVRLRRRRRSRYAHALDAIVGPRSCPRSRDELAWRALGVDTQPLLHFDRTLT